MVRARREELLASDPSYSLRRTADRVGVSPGYLSQVETGKQSPTEERIRAIAADLDLDPDVALAAAGMVSDDLIAVITARPEAFTRLIRQLRDMPEHAVLRLAREVEDGDW